MLWNLKQITVMSDTFVHEQFSIEILGKSSNQVGERHTRGAQAKWEPGTLSEVMSIVTQRNKNTEPLSAKKRRIKMNLQHRWHQPASGSTSTVVKWGPFEWASSTSLRKRTCACERPGRGSRRKRGCNQWLRTFRRPTEWEGRCPERCRAAAGTFSCQVPGRGPRPWLATWSSSRRWSSWCSATSSRSQVPGVWPFRSPFPRRCANLDASNLYSFQQLWHWPSFSFSIES